MELTIGSMFSGIAGLDLAAEHVFGAEPAWFAEFDQAPSKVLAHRYPHVPNLKDVTTVDWAAVKHADIITTGFPCQDVSLMGRRKGMADGTRSGLWAVTRDVIAIQQPAWVIVENVRGLLSARAHSDLESAQGHLGKVPLLRGLGRVLGDLDSLGFDAEWRSVEAEHVGAPHGRFRVFVLAHRRGAPILPATDHRRAGTGGRVALEGQSQGRGEDVPAWFSPGRTVPPRRTEWGRHSPAIRRWERITGRPAPRATEPVGRRGRHGITAAYAEWHQGYPQGWGTGVPGMTRRELVKAFGNSVMPLQAAVALDDMLRTYQEEK